jgi:hypothetical protein
VRRPAAPPGRGGGDRPGGAGALRLLRQLRAAVLRRRCDREGGRPPARDSGHLSADVRHRLPHGVRSRRHLREGQDRRPQGPRDRRGEHGELRQARPLAGRRADPPAAARHRPAGRLPGADGTGCPGGARVGRSAPRRAAGPRLLHRLSGQEEAAPRRRGRRRVHRPRDGGEPHRARSGRHRRAAWRPAHDPRRSRDGAVRRAAPREARRPPPARRRRGRLRADGGRLARSADAIRPDAAGGRRRPRHRRPPRDGAGEDGRRRARRARRDQGRRPAAHERPGHLRRRRRRREVGPRHRPVDAGRSGR